MTKRSQTALDPRTDLAGLLQLVTDNTPQFIFWKDRESVYLGRVSAALQNG